MTRPADIVIALLGAGRASRFGADKLAQPCAGKPLGQWALEAAQATGLPVVWIAGERAPDFVTCEVARNSHASEGMGTSVALAARLAVERGAGALLVMLADMPLVTTDLLARLVEADAPSACAYGSEPGAPALIPATLFGELAALSGDMGAARVLRGRGDVSLVEASAEALFDVDTPQALAEAERLLQSRA
ncbi:nucleotidyltransferase family protein [Novosphingobium sp.]|uniref:nucleotidyltransferase family protein n=1 Tax=Novosphingobium sp. TaxID=1874826 RepID=UPI00286DADD3|nr:nucleotidyltransferase family protein [Novosphingobium sp.]